MDTMDTPAPIAHKAYLESRHEAVTRLSEILNLLQTDNDEAEEESPQDWNHTREVTYIIDHLDGIIDFMKEE